MTQENFQEILKTRILAKSFSSPDEVDRISESQIAPKLITKYQYVSKWEKEFYNATILSPNENGFGEDFKKRGTEGGRYLTRTEMNAILHSGSCHLLNSACGLSRRLGPVGTVMTMSWPGEFRGQICRDDDGKRKIWNYNPAAWLDFKGSVPGYRLKYYYEQNGVNDHPDFIPLVKYINAFSPYTKKICVGKKLLRNGINRLGHLVKLRFPDFSLQTWDLFNRYASNGYSSLTIRLSPFNDVYENPSHFLTSVIACFCSIDNGYYHRKIYEVPSKTQWMYVYLEYNNSRPTIIRGGSHPAYLDLGQGVPAVTYFFMSNVCSRMILRPWSGLGLW